MEFGTNAQPQGSPDVTDEARMQAGSRVHTVLPTHEQVSPDELSDDQVVTQHLIQSAVPNTTNDTEYTDGGSADNIVSPKVPRVALMISVSISLILAAVLVYVFLVLV